MNAPPVQYVTTSDGFDIAYTTRGQGRTFVLGPLPHSHVQLNWMQPGDHLRFLSGLAERYHFIHYDTRGQGLSTRDIADDSTPSSFVLDLEAVIDRLSIERFALYGWGNAIGHVAVHYAVKHPERVEALILHCSAINASAWPASLFVGLPSENWDVYLHQVARARAQGSVTYLPPGMLALDADGFLDHLRRSVKQHDWLASLRAFLNFDDAPLLRQLAVPTLILHQRDFGPLPSEEAVKLAAIIPDARLVLLDGSNLLGDPGQLLQAIDEFLASLPPGAEGRTTATAGLHEVALTGLSAREMEVLKLLAGGKSNAQIADELVISHNTAIRHVSNIFAKIGVENRTEAAAYAHRHGLT